MNKTPHLTNRPTKGWAFAFTAACALAVTSVPAAHAAQQDDAPRIIVKYDVRTLGNDAGARALYHRLEQAARTLYPDDSMHDLARDAIIERERKASVARAVRDINNARLAAQALHGAGRI